MNIIIPKQTISAQPAKTFFVSWSEKKLTVEM